MPEVIGVSSKPLAVVTGASHRLGRTLVLGLARQGYAIGLHYHHSSREAEKTAEEIAKSGMPVLSLKADLRDPEAVKWMFREVAGSQFRLKVLVNSAAVMARGDVRKISAAEWDETMNLNLRAAFLCAQEAARLMEEQGGVIIHIADAGARRLWTGYPVYSLSKIALEALTRLMAKALAPKVRVNAVAPGFILPSSNVGEEEWQRLVAKVPLKRAGLPEEVLQAVLFLVRNEYITGEVINVDGGYQLI
jgi:pteridine reductase